MGQEAPRRSRLPLEVVQHTLWHFGHERDGVQPPPFIAHLLRALGGSLPADRERLRLAYPEYVDAFEIAALRSWGQEYLVTLARSLGEDESSQLDLIGAAS